MIFASSGVSLGAIALAGGKSSRMATDKALLEINGKPLLQKVCEVAQACGANPILVITPWQKKYKFLNLPLESKFIHEPAPQSPLSGFTLGLSNLKTDWVLLLACDLPQLKSDVIQAWSQNLANLPSQAIAFLPKHSKGWEPLCGFYRCSCLESLESYRQKGKYSFQDWLYASRVIEIPHVDPEMLFNCNTPTEYAQVKNTFNK
ncbi:molybdopterin-guanine dinucleotide biosynthesis protein A [Synechococcus sp. PCC 7502]|uniref:molybdenum cofactor guanylyltransferase n=1 Tax=Synechococcus sp. PCC 7502 TaxID=1173263 RepID=UPI00029FCDFD|nr:molybdenum cofactor guanylyltransferase [Synechococcus sp. PCC 7502]AFY72194.1 molybdopterin-guanine dinucleotide biosynthesis protein A [Synechococcus sp. PCC 7502]